MTNISGKRCLLDTNILVAFLYSQHTHHQEGLTVFKRLENGEFKAVISSQNMFELSSVLIHAYKIDPKTVASDLDSFLNEKSVEIVYPDIRVITEFVSLLKSPIKLHTADLYLLATMNVYGIPVIITGDDSWEKFKLPRVAVYNPF